MKQFASPLFAVLSLSTDLDSEEQNNIFFVPTFWRYLMTNDFPYINQLTGWGGIVCVSGFFDRNLLLHVFRVCA